MRFRRTRTGSVLLGTALAVTVTVAAPGANPAGAATNLLKNANFAKVSKGVPQCWSGFKSPGSGAGAGAVKGSKKNRYLQITQNKGTKGERAVVQSAGCAVKARPGQRFTLQVSYKTTAKAGIALFRKDSARGWVRWENLANLKAAKSARKVKVSTPYVPEGTTAVRWGVSLRSAGTLVTNKYGMYSVSTRAACTDAATCAKGRWWTRAIPAPLRAVHVVVLHTGKVLMIAGSGNNPDDFKRGTFKSYLYDPVKDTFKTIKTPIDMFCAGHVQLANGNVLVMSGTKEYGKYDANGVALPGSGFTGDPRSYIFNVKKNRYEKTNNMIDGHWYPSATVMGNGDVMSVGGNAANLKYQDWTGTNEAYVSRVTEQFRYDKKTGAGRWLNVNEVRQTGWHWAMYPSLILMQDGKLFYSGSSVFGNGVERPGAHNGISGGGVWDVKAGTYTEIAGLREYMKRDQSASVLLPPAQDQKVLTLGGGNGGTNPEAIRLADIIDLKKGDPQYRPAKQNIPLGSYRTPVGGDPNKTKMVHETGNMGKMYVSAVLLPDGKVLETGGGLHMRANPVFEASLFNPKTERFTSMNPDPEPRTYHSSSVLLPDGRVMSFGDNPNDNSYNQNMTIFTPPYLAKGNRPVVALAKPKTGWAYGSYQKLKVSQSVGSASLIRPVAVTHSSDPNQRSVALPFKTVKGVTTVHLNNNPNLTPPGWYMLFVTNKAGIPSVAKWVHVG